MILFLFALVATTQSFLSTLHPPETQRPSTLNSHEISHSTYNPLSNLDLATTILSSEEPTTIIYSHSVVQNTSLPTLPTAFKSIVPTQGSQTSTSDTTSDNSLPLEHSSIATSASDLPSDNNVASVPKSLDDQIAIRGLNRESESPDHQPLIIPPAPALPVLQELPVIVLTPASQTVLSTINENTLPSVSTARPTAPPLVSSTAYTPQAHYGQPIQIPLDI